MNTHAGNGATTVWTQGPRTYAALLEAPRAPEGITALLEHAIDADKGGRWLADGVTPGGLETFNLRWLIGFGDDGRGRWTAYTLPDTGEVATYRTAAEIDAALARVTVSRAFTRRTLPAGAGGAGAVKLQIDLAGDAGAARYAATAIGEPEGSRIVRVDLYEARQGPGGRRTRRVGLNEAAAAALRTIARATLGAAPAVDGRIVENGNEP